MSKQCGALSPPALAFAGVPAGCSSSGIHRLMFLHLPLPPLLSPPSPCRHPRGAGLQRRRPRRPVLRARAAPLPGREGGGAGALPHHVARGGGHLLCLLLRLVRADSDAFLRADVPLPFFGADGLPACWPAAGCQPLGQPLGRPEHTRCSLPSSAAPLPTPLTPLVPLHLLVPARARLPLLLPPPSRLLLGGPAC